MKAENHLVTKLWLFVAVGGLCLLLSASPAVSMGMGGIGGGGDPSPTLELSAGPMVSPVRVALMTDLRNGRKRKQLLVTDYGQNAVFKVNPNNPDDAEPLFTTKGKPLSIVRKGRYLFVGNKSKGAIDVRGHDGRLVRAISVGSPMQPNDLAIDRGLKRLFVADGKAGDVKMFRLDGQFIRSIDGAGDLHDPRGVAVNTKSKTLAVSDFGDPVLGIEPSIQLYDYRGNQQLKISGGFSGPGGLVLTSTQIMVADALLGQILVFDRVTGAKTGTFGSFGTGESQLLFPMDLDYDRADQKLYVVNNRLGKISVFLLSDFNATEVPQ